MMLSGDNDTPVRVLATMLTMPNSASRSSPICTRSSECLNEIYQHSFPTSNTRIICPTPFKAPRLPSPCRASIALVSSIFSSVLCLVKRSSWRKTANRQSLSTRAKARLLMGNQEKQRNSRRTKMGNPWSMERARKKGLEVRFGLDLQVIH